MRKLIAITVVLTAILAVMLIHERRAEACGCLSPPVVAEGDFAVNQQSEQIIFETDGEFVTAHVLIRYAGAPEQFAWIVPAPEVPEFGLSPASAFSLLDTRTRPAINTIVENICPEQKYVCLSHASPICGGDGDFLEDGGGDGDGDGDGLADAGANGGDMPPVEVLDETVIGSYQTVTFSAGDAAAAVAWLNSEGFVVNDTMAPFMQPYADAGMVFVASKLIAGADVSAIKPLRMRYRAQNPMIPLRLTAVAAEPHMTITAYIYGKTAYQVTGHPYVSIPESALSTAPDGRSNYPMVLSRAIDDVGGDGFIAEYVGAPVIADFDQGTGCCDAEFDFCGIGGDGACQCPGSSFEESDCGESAPDLVEGANLLQELATKHQRLTRVTTRLSAHEMTFDPSFEPLDAASTGRLQLTAASKSLANCESAVLDTRAYQRAKATQECAATYCGSGECVVTDEDAGCRCALNEVARKFTDLDGRPSVTCVPEVGVVDLEAGGLELPDACAQVSCGAGGSCVDVGGFATCSCADGSAAALGTSPNAPVCRPIESLTGSVGAQDFSEAYEDVSVCAPEAPASCGPNGWLIAREVAREGVQCSAPPAPARFRVPAEPTCGFLNRFGCGCNTSIGVDDAGAPLALLFLGWIVVWRRRRRRE